MTLVEPELGVALWRKVADSIERKISDGSYLSGAKLPSETEIAQTHRVNRHTVRRALAALAERGLVRAERGSGTYVERARLAYPLRTRTRFSEIVGAGGREPRGRLLNACTEPATKELAQQLRLKAGAPLLRIDGLRLADRVPICLGTTWLPADRFPDAEDIYRRTGSMTRVLAHHGVRDYRRAETKITAAIADAGDAAQLDLRLGSPVLIVEARDVENDGRPLLAMRSRFAADRVQFVVEQD